MDTDLGRDPLQLTWDHHQAGHDLPLPLERFGKVELVYTHAHTLSQNSGSRKQVMVTIAMQN